MCDHLRGQPGADRGGDGRIHLLLHERGIQAAIETQGSRWQDWFLEVDVLTISPKPPSSGMQTDWDKLDEIMHRAADNGKAAHSLKVVVFNQEDYEYARKVHYRYPEVPLFLQPGNDNVTEEGDISGRLLGRLEWLFGLVIADPQMNRARVLPQLHALIWHNKRGNSAPAAGMNPNRVTDGRASVTGEFRSFAVIEMGQNCSLRPVQLYYN